jgi:hypothetical protein
MNYLEENDDVYRNRLFEFVKTYYKNSPLVLMSYERELKCSNGRKLDSIGEQFKVARKTT